MSKIEKYGIFIGRFQPLHNAHLKLIKIIMADKLKPFIVIGSTQEKRNLKRNPLTFEQRRQLIEVVLPIENIVALEDCHSNLEKWYSNLIKLLPPKEDCVIYYCVKPRYVILLLKVKLTQMKLIIKYLNRRIGQ